MLKIVRTEDLAACVDVIRQSFATVAEEFGFTPENAPRFTAFAVTEERLAWQMRQGRPMIACWEDGRIVGYYSLEIKGETCELNNLCVLPGYRHGGRGKILLTDAFARAKTLGCRTMHIGIVAENLRLRRWYETNGFVYTREEKFDFFPFTCGYMEKVLEDQM
ncbi:MAG: GNAT family N-acetyltransferase [Clostridia bacterium]|nr:GNAT family N-acetyltransferase [Clostridia bacterium]